MNIIATISKILALWLLFFMLGVIAKTITDKVDIIGFFILKNWRIEIILPTITGFIVTSIFIVYPLYALLANVLFSELPFRLRFALLLSVIVIFYLSVYSFPKYFTGFSIISF